LTIEEKIDRALQLVQEVCEEIESEDSDYSKGTKTFIHVFKDEHYIGKIEQLQRVVHKKE
jgi:hypothetical protein